MKMKIREKYDEVNRVEQNIAECWDEENKEFDWDDWDTYRYLCDCFTIEHMKNKWRYCSDRATE